MTAGELWREFLDEYDRLPTVEDVQRWRYWTGQWLGILQRTASHHGFLTKVEKPVRIDMSWYDARYLDPVAAIEVETEEDSIWESEIPNLLYSCARLKVILTYVTQEREQYFIARIREFLERRSDVLNGEEFLGIFVLYHRTRGVDTFDEWRAHLFMSKREGSSIMVTEELLPETRKIR